MEELVRGVWFAPNGESLEQVSAPSMDMHLLAAWDGTEVIRQEIPRGKRVGLRPEDGWEAMEHVYIIQGEAEWSDGKRTVRFGPGDSLTGKPVREPCIITALTDVTTLYICSRPAFHQISNELVRLAELAVAVELKDGYTSEHCRRIQELSARVGRQMQLSPQRQHYLLYGSFLHDLGKVDVPDEILNKPGRLTAEEWTIMKRHPLSGYDLLVKTSLAGAAPILAQHHERLDGSGYPFGLRGDEISLEAQIVAVVDSYDAMTSDRVYRPALSREQAVAELKRGAGSLYRADVVDAFLEAADLNLPHTASAKEDDGVCA